MYSYGYNIEWNGYRWIDTDDKEFPNRMDPNRCSKCAAKYIVFSDRGQCSVCDPADPQWEVYRLEATRLGRAAPAEPLPTPDPKGDLRLIEMDDGTKQWIGVDDLCVNCEEAPVALPQGYRREVEDQRGTLCEMCQN